MCYSAKVWADYRLYMKKFGARIDTDEFVQLLEQRMAGAKLMIPREVTDVLKHLPQSAEEQHCSDLIQRYEAQEASRLEEQLYTQRRRLADAERALATKPTKKATEERRIASNKVTWLLGKLEDLRRPPGRETEARIYPGVFCPVMTMDRDGGYVIVPTRYQCRPAGKPAAYDQRYPGTYNARRDNLQDFWRSQYGTSHAVIAASAFYENVARHRLEGRELDTDETQENRVLQFAPGNGQLMLIACLWSRWSGPGQADLLSFAAITDEPPPEIQAAGHDRCIIPVKPANVATWLATPAPDAVDYEAILDDRERPFYAHLLAA